jgi:hypothetical protein
MIDVERIKGYGGGTVKQRVARARNYMMFQLLGLVKPLDYSCMTEQEVSLWNDLKRIRRRLIDIHGESSEKITKAIEEEEQQQHERVN